MLEGDARASLTRSSGMRLRHLLLAITCTAAIGLGAGAARAEDPPFQHWDPEWCKQYPHKCTDEVRAKREAWCKDNPEKCTRLKQRAVEFRDWCEKNPEECEAKKERIRKRWEGIEAHCAKEPERCDELREKQHERWMKRHGF